MNISVIIHIYVYNMYMCIYHFNTANRKRFVRLIYEILIMLIMYINILIIFRENVKCEEELFIKE